jgi:hypothetical protein
MGAALFFANCRLIEVNGLANIDVCFCGHYWGQSGHAILQCERPLMTQSGHAPFN